jgi:AcrR family transcriptional regulator
MPRTAARQRNRRGEGAKLASDILAAANALLEETGSEDAVTLRAIARHIGIAAPSIYEHFPDRETIVEAVVDTAFVELHHTLQEALSGEPEPFARLRAGCLAYLQFGAERPNRYRVMFARHQHIAPNPRPSPRVDPFELLVGALTDCVKAGVSTSNDPVGDATAIWVALHGYATLHPSLPGFPWPATETTLDRILSGLAHHTEKTRPRTRRPRAKTRDAKR